MAEDTKIFGMKAESGRWLLVVTGLLINICLGTVYAWSVFKAPLKAQWADLTAFQSALPFTVFLAFFAILMWQAGKLMDKFSPRTVAIIGAVIMGIGWIMSKYAPNIWVLTATYGIIAGSGVGIIYGVPIAVAGRWFPDKKGLAVGLTVAGFGGSALITAPLAKWLIGPADANFMILGATLANGSPAIGVMDTFFYLGIAFLFLTVILSMIMVFPPAGYKPAGWTPPPAAKVAVDLDASGMIKTPSFYGLWLCFIIGSLAGLTAIGIAAPCGKEIVKCSADAAAMAVSIFAIFNAVGRPIFGWVTDKLTPRYAAVLSFVIIFVASLIMIFMVAEGAMGLYIVAFCMFWLCLGGWLAIAPTSNITYFGAKNAAKNYGIVFSAYGIGAIIGNLTSGYLKDWLGGFLPTFYMTGGMAIVGIVIALVMMKPPAKK
jgi:MFS transporter, OFA family, oxalate/formate antiporter